MPKNTEEAEKLRKEIKVLVCGTTCSGKTTIIAIIAQALAESGFDVDITTDTDITDIHKDHDKKVKALNDRGLAISLMEQQFCREPYIKKLMSE